MLRGSVSPYGREGSPMKLAVIGRNSAELKKKLEHRDVILCEPGDADVILA